MKTLKNIKYIGLIAIAIGFTSCNDESDYEEFLDVQPDSGVVLPTLTNGSVDFSKYVALGASFTSGYTDGALFKAAQENSFPNTLSKQFVKVNGNAITLPLMNDNIGGFVFGSTVVANPRLFFNGSGPQVLPATPTTDVTTSLAADGSIFTNVGIPGAKSTHIDLNGYATANPYFGRMATTPAISMLEYALAQNPTFFTLSEIGGNDVLGYATSGGESDTSSVDYDPITPTATFDVVFTDMVNQLTDVCPNGVVTNVPYITNLPHFTTVPYNPVPLDAPTAGALNQGYAGYNGGIQAALAALTGTGLFTAEEAAARTIVFAEGDNAMVIVDETLTDLGAINPAFATIPKYRQATAEDLFVLPLSSLIPQGYGTQIPLEDKWVLLPSEQMEIKTATDAYNATIASVANIKGLALVDLNAILSQASSTGVPFDTYNLTTDLVTGGLVSLDGIHLTARGYALMANKFLEEIDATYGSNFIASGNVAKAEDFSITYSPTLQ